MRITDVGGYLESEERKRQVKRDRELFAYGKEDRTHVESGIFQCRCLANGRMRTSIATGWVATVEVNIS